MKYFTIIILLSIIYNIGRCASTENITQLSTRIHTKKHRTKASFLDRLKQTQDSINRLDLLEKGDAYDKAVKAGKIKPLHLHHIAPNTGYDASAGQVGMQDMSAGRSKYDEGLDLWDNVQEHRKEKQAEERQKQLLWVVLSIVVIGVIIVIATIKTTKKEVQEDDIYKVFKNKIE